MNRYRISNLKVDYKLGNSFLIDTISKKLRINKEDIVSLNIIKRSIDARKKPDIKYVYTLDICVKKHIEKKISKQLDLAPSYKDIEIDKIITKYRPVIIGSGPSGLFCALILSRAGVNPIVIEQGMDVDTRHEKIVEFFKKEKLDEMTNVQFGEGGAGTYSDGKLNTSVKDFRNRFILNELVKAGANEKILYENKPHIGTDVLKNIVKNIRNEIICNGGKFEFDTKFLGLEKNFDIITVKTNKNIYKTDKLILAIGNSSRDTFLNIKNAGIYIETKPFAVGYRVQHDQRLIDEALYGSSISELGPADYKLTYTTKDNIPVYSFCMCPGGYVVNSSSENGKLVINGMSYSLRNSKNANSAIIMGVKFDTVEEAISFQDDIEKKAFYYGNGKIPTMTYKDYKDNKKSDKLGNILPRFKGGYYLTNIRGILPKKLELAFIEAMENFGNRIKGFNNDDVIVSAVESRTSSPVRINRDENFVSNIDGVYPIGEGAGYAGGIMSAAIDGVKVAQSILKGYKYE